MSQESETLQNLRNRRESARLNIEWRMPLVDDAIAHAANLEQQAARLEEELERERLRLAGCGVAAMSNTEETVKQRINSDNPYYSASYQAVCSAVDREMKYRDEIKRLEEENGRLRALVAGTEQSILIIESLCKDELAKRDMKRLREFIKDPTARAAQDEDDDRYDDCRNMPR